MPKKKPKNSKKNADNRLHFSCVPELGIGSGPSKFQLGTLSLLLFANFVAAKQIRDTRYKDTNPADTRYTPGRHNFRIVSSKSVAEK